MAMTTMKKAFRYVMSDVSYTGEKKRIRKHAERRPAVVSEAPAFSRSLFICEREITQKIIGSRLSAAMTGTFSTRKPIPRSTKPNEQTISPAMIYGSCDDSRSESV
jgi:hypothetical protein